MLRIDKATAPLVEVFCSIQGEGIHVGRRQIFVRTFGCNLSCDYCDTLAALRTPHSALRIGEWSVFSPEGEISSHPNPATVDEVIAAVRELERISGPHHSASITGGEPLLHPRFVADLARGLGEIGLPVHLETNATLPEALAEVLPHVDVVAADVKLKSAAGENVHLSLHREFLSLVAQAGKEVFVKMIVTEGTDLNEVEAAAEMVAEVNAGIPLVIQPATAVPGKPYLTPTGASLAEMQRVCLRHLRDVRAIPQCHKILGVR